MHPGHIHLGTEPGRGQAHLHCSFAHSFKGISASFGGWTLVHQVAQDRCGGKYSKVYLVKSLGAESGQYQPEQGARARARERERATYQTASNQRRMPDGV